MLNEIRRKRDARVSTARAFAWCERGLTRREHDVVLQWPRSGSQAKGQKHRAAQFLGHALLSINPCTSFSPRLSLSLPLALLLSPPVSLHPNPPTLVQLYYLHHLQDTELIPLCPAIHFCPHSLSSSLSLSSSYSSGALLLSLTISHRTNERRSLSYSDVFVL